MAAYESEVAEAIKHLGDAIMTHARVTAILAAGAHSDSDYRQREMGGVFFEDAKGEFADILRKVGKAKREQMHRYIDGLCRGKK